MMISNFSDADHRRFVAPAVLQAFMLALLLMVSGCASMRPEVTREPSQAIATDSPTTLGQFFAEQAREYPGQSGFKVLATGRAAFVARVELAGAAERTLDLQYYSVSDDLSSDLLLLRIADAAERGVRVRVLLDDIYAPSRQFANRAAALHPGVQVRLFNPFFFGGTTSLGRLAEFAFDGARLNRRMHNKLWVVDNAAAIVGSRNLGDEYFDAHEAANFSDAEVLAAGPIVPMLSASFDAYWNSAAAVPIGALVPDSDRLDGASVRQRLDVRAITCGLVPPCPWQADHGVLTELREGAASLSWGPAQLHFDAPEFDKSRLVTGIEHGSLDDHPGGSRTRNELLIVSPYFIPGSDGRRHLAEMRERGARVVVLTNSLASTDSPAAHAGYARHRVELLQAGVELYESRPQPGMPHARSHRWGKASPSSLHAKMIVQDRFRSIIGSFNQDPRSRLHNTEAWIAIDSRALAADLAALFEEGTGLEHAFKVELNSIGTAQQIEWKTEELGTVVRYAVEPMVDAWLRLWRDTLGALIPEHLL